jgi:hydrogenase maturation protein HypF
VVSACSVRVRGVVQGVGFRPFVYRLAQERTVAGWVANDADGVDMHLEGDASALRSFVLDLETRHPPAAVISAIEVHPALLEGLDRFVIRESNGRRHPTTRMSPDLPVCNDCLAELFDPDDRRYWYPYINCTNCGPRYSVTAALPYDRPNTTMRAWPLVGECAHEYHDPEDRRFHAQPVACPACGPAYFLRTAHGTIADSEASIRRAAAAIRRGAIVAIKGIGGYHLACDARNADAVRNLRERKFRKDKPFAVMARDVDRARALVSFTPAAEALLRSPARPIVLGAARAELAGVAPESGELGVMLPYAPLHYLLFAAGAPDVLVMTSANRSSEPIAYEDHEAVDRLEGIAEAFLIGERPIARRVDDSVVRDTPRGPTILRRSRGYAPGVVATLPSAAPILALGADLKNSVTIVVNGEAMVSHHIGDLDHYGARSAFDEAVADLLAMYGLGWSDVVVAHDSHPEYASTVKAKAHPCLSYVAVQHHRAHIASVMAERGELRRRVVGVSFDGTGYGDDGSIWGGEFFVGSVADGFERVAHLRPSLICGGDAAAKSPVQAAAGFLEQLEGLPDMLLEPFRFPRRYADVLRLQHARLRVFTSTSAGRLFDAAAALLGFTREITFEGQAAMWLEHLAAGEPVADAYPCPFDGSELDFRPLIRAVVVDRARGRDVRAIARAFQRGVATGMCRALVELSERAETNAVVLSGGVFQNALLLDDVAALIDRRLDLWINHAVPPNDGGISLGQAAIAACSHVQG